MDKKIIFLDIDGTLTEPGGNVPPASAIRAIKGAQEKGNYVFLCTGRNYDMLSPLLKYGFDGVIASSGGYIRYQEEEIYNCPIAEKQKNEAMELLKKNGIFRTIECMDGSYTDKEFKEFLEKNASEGSNSEMLRWRRQIEKSLHIRPMEEYAGQPAYKIVMMCWSKAQLKEPMELLGGEFSFCVQEPDRFGFINGELLSREYDKGRAVIRVCRHLGISQEQTAAFGDSMNDKEMMEAAAVSICMENGSAALKELADDICPAVTDDGLYQAFKKHGLM